MCNVIKGKFDITKKGKYSKKEVSEILFDIYYEEIKKVGWNSHSVSIKEVADTPIRFANQMVKIIQTSADYHCGLDVSTYSQKIYGVYGVISNQRKKEKKKRLVSHI